MHLRDLPPTLSVEEAGRILGMSRSTAYRAARRGDLPTVRLSGRLLVPTSHLLGLLGLEDDVDERITIDLAG